MSIAFRREIDRLTDAVEALTKRITVLEALELEAKTSHDIGEALTARTPAEFVPLTVPTKQRAQRVG